MEVDIFRTKNKYDIIYADPPWQYTKNFVNRGKARSVEKEYQTLAIDDICNLPVKEISNKNSILFLWTTSPKLELSFNVIKEWGFNYKTVGFVWIKQNKKSSSKFFGMGFYTRQNAEFLLIATKGKGIKRISNSVFQIIETHIEGHSKKPNEARDRIVELCGDIPRIELFARQSVNGWDCWGNEIDKDTKQISLFEE